MSKQTKIIIGVIAGILVLCLAICVVGALWFNIIGKRIASDAKPDPQKAVQTASEIADFTPPAGYQPSTGMKILGYTIVVYTSGESSSTNMLMLMQIPGTADINDATIVQMQQAIETQSGRQMNNMKVVETRDLTIRGKPARVIVQEGSYAGNLATIRQMMVVFQGKGGVAMLMTTASADAWNQQEMDQMVESIH